MILIISGRELLTDDGRLIKRLSCPKNRPEIVHSEKLGYVCMDCERRIHGTAELSDDQALALMKLDPEGCLLISAGQANVRLVE